MRERVENVSLFLFLGLALFMLIKLMIYVVTFFKGIGIDTSSVASMT